MVGKKHRKSTMKNGPTVRGQAAMEYLMTYGWAILVILIVLAVLAFYLPQFIGAQEQCAFAQPGFTCGDVKPYISNPSGTQVTLAATVFNQIGQQVTIQKILCTTDAPGNVRSDSGQPATTAMVSPMLDVPAGGKAAVTVNCYKNVPATSPPGGTNAVTLGKNNDFRGYLLIWFNYANEPTGNVRQAQATITGKVN